MGAHRDEIRQSGLSGTSRADDRNKAAVQIDRMLLHPRSCSERNASDRRGRNGVRGRLRSDPNPLTWLDDRLTQRFERQIALQPAESFLCWLSYCGLIVRVGTVEARLQRAVAFFDEVAVEFWVFTQPKSPVFFAPRKNDIGEPLEFETHGRECGIILQTGGAIS